MINRVRGLYVRFSDRTRKEGLRNALLFTFSYVSRRFRPLYQIPSIYIHSRLSEWLNVFNEEWDLLIVLDTCRPDALRRVSDEYSYITEIKTRWSVGASSPEWMHNTFDQSFRHEISNTALVTSNAYAWGIFESGFENNPLRHSVDDTPGQGVRPSVQRLKKYAVTSPVDRDSFDNVILIRETSEQYGPVECPSPRRVTDHIIKLDRSSSPPSRIIAHYIPPHTPYIARLVDGEIQFTEKPRDPTSFEAYIDNLRWALGEVSLLLENVDREAVVITADHGENFRWRSIRPNHLPGMLTPAVRRVPWVETSASDERTYVPDLSDADSSVPMSPETTLEALGYI